MTIEYLKERNKFLRTFVVCEISVEIVDPPLEDVDVRLAITKVCEMIPSHLRSRVKIIKIGDFSILSKRDLQATYHKSCIYVTNNLSSEKDLIDDIVHEIAHSIEEKYTSHIYGDDTLKHEFLKKREKLWNLLKNKGYSVELESFLNPDYQIELDEILYKEIGYPVISAVSSGIFYSPYAATSLREYFANGFEAFYMEKEIQILRRISPILYKKIENLLSLKDNTREKENNDF